MIMSYHDFLITKLETNLNEYLQQYITIYREDFLFCVHISKFQFYLLKYNYLLNFLKLTVFLQAFYKIVCLSFFSFPYLSTVILSSFLIYFILSLTIYKEDSLFCIHISKFQFVSFKI